MQAYSLKGGAVCMKSNVPFKHKVTGGFLRSRETGESRERI